MKKILAIIMVVAMLCCTACGQITEEDKELVRGAVENGVFTSEFGDFTFTPPSTWTFASDDEILAMMDLSAADMTEEEKKNLELGNLKTVYDAMVAGTDGANVIIMYENLALTIGGTSYDEAAYAEALSTGLVSQGITSDAKNLGEVTIGSNKYVVFTGTSASDGVTIEQKYLLRKIDNYMLCICITTVPGMTTSYDHILKMFA